MLDSLCRSWWKSLSVRAADLALRLGPVRRWAINKGDGLLYDFYCVKRFEGLPLGVQEYRHRVAMTLLRCLDRAVADGRFAGKARRGLLRVFVGNAVMNARKNVAPFIAQHGYEPPAFLVVSPTQRCNLCCTGCYSASSSKATATLEYDVLARLIADKRDNWGSYFTTISGGEPLMYRSQGKTLLDLFREFNDTYFLMFTNGTLLDEKVAQQLADLGNVTPAISVEGFQKETDARRGKGVYQQIEKAMGALRRAGVPFGVSLTATRENAETLLSEEIVRHYFDEGGAIYSWLFHYMPIGRGYTVDLMVTPEQRMRMLERQLDLLNNRGLLFIDFWNGGPMSGGCMSAGRAGGFFHVDWNGDVSPCVFIPYAVDNVYDMYRSGRPLTSVLDHPAMKSLRKWQLDYAGNHGTTKTNNMFTPCPIRDHHEVAHDVIVKFGARPLHADAAAALSDQEYFARMVDYGKELSALLEPAWEREVASRDPTKP